MLDVVGNQLASDALLYSIRRDASSLNASLCVATEVQRTGSNVIDNTNKCTSLYFNQQTHNVDLLH